MSPAKWRLSWPESPKSVMSKYFRGDRRPWILTEWCGIIFCATNPFNLIYGDHDGVEVAYASRDGIERHALPPGIHVLTNDRIGSSDFPKADRARQLAEELPRTGFDWPEVRGVLADHALPDPTTLGDPPAGSIFTAELLQRLQAICIHTPVYGTRSATAIVADRGAVLDYRFADGAPCEAPLTSVRHLFDRPLG